jgi:hypothetical protein
VAAAAAGGGGGGGGSAEGPSAVSTGGGDCSGPAAGGGAEAGASRIYDLSEDFEQLHADGGWYGRGLAPAHGLLEFIADVLMSDSDDP